MFPFLNEPEESIEFEDRDVLDYFVVIPVYPYSLRGSIPRWMNQRIVSTTSGESGMPVDGGDGEFFVCSLVEWLGETAVSLKRGRQEEDEFNACGSHALNQALDPLKGLCPPRV